MTAVAASSDLVAVKARQQLAWSSGNYSVVGTTLQIVGENLCEAIDLRAGERVLDVAAGNGNATLAAARRYADVTSTDYVPGLLEDARMRAEAEGLEVRFEVADAERLLYSDGEFDVVLSTFGVMFTPDQERAASELARVTRSGGRIGLANWTPEGFVGQMFRLIGKYVPSAPGTKSPALWGMFPHIDQLFRGLATKIHATPRSFSFRYRSVEHFIEVFRTYYGPMHKAFASLVPDQQRALEQDLRTLVSRGNRALDGTVVLPSEYLEIVIERR
jgi:ubiquinone/menaquinone biosynthesis C-methylase UbiE